MTEIGATDCPASPIGLRRSCLPQPSSRAAKMAVGPVATGAFGGRNGAEAGVVSGGAEWKPSFRSTMKQFVGAKHASQQQVRAVGTLLRRGIFAFVM